MKRSRVIFLIVGALLVMMIFFGVNVAMAMACDVSPQSGPPGTTITVGTLFIAYTPCPDDVDCEYPPPMQSQVWWDPGEPTEQLLGVLEGYGYTESQMVIPADAEPGVHGIGFSRQEVPCTSFTVLGASETPSVQIDAYPVATAARLPSTGIGSILPGAVISGAGLLAALCRKSLRKQKADL